MHVPRLLALLPLPLLLLLLPSLARASCEVRLPVVSTAASPQPTPVTAVPADRLLSGLDPSEDDFDNIVVLKSDQDLANCAGSLIAARWVLTAAQCFVSPRSTVLVKGVNNADGLRFGVATAVPHPDWGIASDHIERNDIQLILLDKPVFTPRPSPSPDDPSPSPSNPPAAPPPTAVPRNVREDGAQPAPSPTPPLFNVMRLNTNPKFAQEPDAPRYLRVKGFGVRTRPGDGQDPLDGTRPLTFADLMTASCDDDFGNDDGRRLCTKKDNDCGPCFGDTGAPLYDVDRSGKVSVLVGIVTFGLTGIAVNDAESVCTRGDRPTVYTAVAPYVPWIRETTAENLTEVFIPREGITNTNLDPGENRFAIVARTSIIVIASLALIGFIGFLLVTCTLRTLRRRRKRWVEGLHAEDSFVKGDEKDAGIADPFEGILEDHKTPRLSVNSLSRAAVKSATEFSARSIGTIRAMLMNMEDEEMLIEPREPMDDAPQWLPGAWEKLFKPPSKKDLEHIHKIRTQRVVDDVLEGGDKSVEPSLESVAFKNARDEANLEAAWKKLEIQTSLRNLSEASGSQDGLSQPSTNPSTRGNSSRLLSRHSSRGGTHGALSSFLGGGRDGGADIAKADTLLAAFASIDAESEHVAEETVIDSSALRALASSKRPKVLETLRRKFSGGPLMQSTSNKSGDGDPTSPRTKRSSRKAIDGNTAASAGESSPRPAVRVGSGPTLTLAALANRPKSGFGRGLSGLEGSGISIGELSAELGGQGSMRIMDYFSESYTLSSSSDDEEPKEFDIESASRRFTEDRPDALESEHSLRGFRKGLTRSFETLEQRNSGNASSYDDDDDNRTSAAPAPEIDSVVAEGTMADTIPTSKSRTSAMVSISTPSSSGDNGRRATDRDGSLSMDTGVDSVRAEGFPDSVRDRLPVSRRLRQMDDKPGIQSEEGGALEASESGVDTMSMISVAALKDMWNELARRDSEASSSGADFRD